VTDDLAVAAAREAAVEIALPCPAWFRACPEIGMLAESTARLALARGLAAAGLRLARRVMLDIRLGDDAEQRRLNRRYRGRDAATNVLAFPATSLDEPLPPAAPLLLGDVILAFETVAREAVEQHKPLGDHLRHLVAHGVLHLLGYDHANAADAKTMEALERDILAALGVPDPYDDTM
jgi:probable rRNA maturation factor